MWRGLGICTLAVTGCTSVLGIDSDRHLVVDGGPPPVADSSPWGCLDLPAEQGSGSATITFVVGDPSTSATTTQPEGKHLPGIVMQACGKFDLSCSSPIAVSAPTDSAGRTGVTVPVGFDGYFQTVPGNGYLPSIYAREPVVSSATTIIGVVREQILQILAGLAGAMRDPSLGAVIASALNCQSVGAAGVTIDVGPLVASEDLFYLANSLPSKTAKVTDTSATAIAFNVPLGTVNATGTNAAGKQINSVTAVVRAGWVTFVQLRPNEATPAPPPAE